MLVLLQNKPGVQIRRLGRSSALVETQLQSYVIPGVTRAVGLLPRPS